MRLCLRRDRDIEGACMCLCCSSATVMAAHETTPLLVAGMATPAVPPAHRVEVKEVRRGVLFLKPKLAYDWGQKDHHRKVDALEAVLGSHAQWPLAAVHDYLPCVWLGRWIGTSSSPTWPLPRTAPR